MDARKLSVAHAPTGTARFYFSNQDHSVLFAKVPSGMMDSRNIGTVYKLGAKKYGLLSWGSHQSLSFVLVKFTARTRGVRDRQSLVLLSYISARGQDCVRALHSAREKKMK